MNNRNVLNATLLEEKAKITFGKAKILLLLKYPREKSYGPNTFLRRSEVVELVDKI